MEHAAKTLDERGFAGACEVVPETSFLGAAGGDRAAEERTGLARLTLHIGGLIGDVLGRDIDLHMQRRRDAEPTRLKRVGRVAPIPNELGLAGQPRIAERLSAHEMQVRVDDHGILA